MLDIKNVSLTFNKGTIDETVSLDDVSLHLEPGDFMTVIGSNGAGKSTLMNVISGTLISDKGQITLDGKDITMTPSYVRARSIGRLFQDPMAGTAPGMTIGENLALAAGKGGWFSTVSHAEKKAFRERLAKLGMGLEDRLDSPVGLLSGGQRQALTLMMATYNAPKLLLLDEHTAALDPATAEKVLEITKDVIETNHLTCLMITHNMKDALALGNRTIMMNKGRIIFETSGEERKNITVSDLLAKFREGTGAALDNDRMLLS